MVTIKCSKITDEIKEVAKMISDHQQDTVIVTTDTDKYEVKKDTVKKTPREGEEKPHQ